MRWNMRVYVCMINLLSWGKRSLEATGGFGWKILLGLLEMIEMIDCVYPSQCAYSVGQREVFRERYTESDESKDYVNHQLIESSRLCR